MMIYPSRKNVLTSLILWAASLLLIGTSIYTFIEAGINIHSFVLSIISLASVGLILWIWFKTYYRIQDDILFYRSGPIAGRIDISKIREIIPNKTLYVGLKPALATKGLVIKYEKYNDIYISPVRPEAFIEDLIKVNSTITVTL